MGTRPYTEMILLTLFKGFSDKAKNMIAGPMVINKYSNEGGYLVHFINDNMVNNQEGCWLQADLSPYTLLIRSNTKTKTKSEPIHKKNFFLFTGSYVV